MNCIGLLQVDEAASQREAVEQQLSDVLNAQVKSISVFRTFWTDNQALKFK